MKKIVLSLAGALVATAFAPEAAAIPAYARQVGMACTACHAQHFPVLNSFGRAFKASGYTMMGAQGKVEGDHLSMPDTLNLSMIIKLRYLKDNTSNAVGALPANARGATKADGMWEFADELALIGGGRIAENVGFFFEGQMLSTGPFVGILRMPFVWDMGGAKLSVVPFMTDGGSAMVGYELSSGGILRANRWAEDRTNTSAVQYVRGIEEASGIAFVAQNDMGFINVTPYTADTHYKNNATGSGGLKSTYIRVAATPTVGDWAMVVGAGRMSGQSYSGLNAEAFKTEMTYFDFQAHGEVGGKEIGIYAQHAKAPHTTGFRNAYNTTAVCAVGAACNPDKKATTIGVDYSVIPHSLHIGAAYLNAKSGGVAASNGDKVWTLSAVYDLYQNVALHGWYNSMSGSRNAAGTGRATSAYSMMLEMAW